MHKMIFLPGQNELSGTKYFLSVLQTAIGRTILLLLIKLMLSTVKKFPAGIQQDGPAIGLHNLHGRKILEAILTGILLKEDMAAISRASSTILII